MTYKDSTYYISSYAKLSTEMPSGEMYKVLDMGCIIDMERGIILDVSITLLTKETRDFIKQLIVDYDLNKGIEGLINKVKKRYYGASQRTICVVVKNIYEKYLLLKANY